MQRTQGELYEAIYNTKKELFALRLQKTTSQLRQTHLIREKKRDVARFMSQLSEFKKIKS